MNMEKSDERLERFDQCNWDSLTDCRHPEWWITAQKTVDAMHLSIAEIPHGIEYQFDKLKEGCKLCLIAEIGRQLRLLSARS